MTQATKVHAYRGHTIYPCESGEHRGQWTVQIYHRTGNPFADELCPHYQTLAAAQESIDESAHADQACQWCAEPLWNARTDANGNRRCGLCGGMTKAQR